MKEHENLESQHYTDWHVDKELQLKEMYVDELTAGEIKDRVIGWLLDEFVEIYEEEFEKYCKEMYNNEHEHERAKNGY